MPRVALLEWLETAPPAEDGTRFWRPDIPHGVGAWAAFDLRSYGFDGAIGYAKELTVPLPDKPGRIDLGESLGEPLPPKIARQIENKLGIDIPPGTTPAELIAELAGDKLPTYEVEPGKFRRRIRLLDQVFDLAPVIRGGATDDFNRANGGLGANWAVCQAAMAISGNKVVIGSNPSSMFYTGTFNNDQYSQAACTCSVSGFYMVSTIVRASPANGGECYFTRLCGSCGDVALGKRVAFSQSEFASGGTITTSVPFTVTMKLVATGSSLEGFIGGVSVVSSTDTDLTAGNPGIQIATTNTTDASIDDFDGGDNTVAAVDRRQKPIVVLTRRRPRVQPPRVAARPARSLVTVPRASLRRVVGELAPRAFRRGVRRDLVRAPRLLDTVPVTLTRRPAVVTTAPSSRAPGGVVGNARPAWLYADALAPPAGPLPASRRVVLTPPQPRAVYRAVVGSRRGLFADAVVADELAPFRRPTIILTPPPTPHVRSVHTFTRVGLPFGPDVRPCLRPTVIRSTRIVAPPTGVHYSQRQRLFADVPVDAARRPNIRIEVRIPGPGGAVVLYTRAPWRLFTPAAVEASRRPRVIETVRIPFTRVRLLIHKPTPRTFMDPPPAVGMCTGWVEISPMTAGAPAAVHVTGFVTVTPSEGQAVAFTARFSYGYVTVTTATGSGVVVGASGTIRR